MPKSDMYNDLVENLTLSTYGVTNTLKHNLSVDDDININLNDNNIGYVSATTKANIVDTSIRNGRKKESMTDDIKRIMEETGRANINNIPYDERIKLNQELNFMMTQMPQLADTLDALADNILSPDEYTEGSITVTVPESTSSADASTVSDREMILKNSLYENICKEAIATSLKLGYCYVAVVPYTDIANRVLAKVGKGKSKKGIKNLPKNVVLYGENISPTEEATPIAEGDIFATVDNVIAESYGDTVGNTIAESSDIASKNTESNDTDKFIHDSVNSIFTASPYSKKDRGAIARQVAMCNKLTAIAEADVTLSSAKAFNTALKNVEKQAKTNRRENISRMTGCSVEILDNENTFPIIINKEIIGVLKIDRLENQFASKPVYDNFNNVTGSNSYKDKSDYSDNPLIRRQIVDELSNKIKSHLDENFVIDNKRILTAIENLLDDNDNYANDFNIRFISRKDIVPFNAKDVVNGLGKSKLMRARIPAIFWILLNNNKMITKLFYEKDKIVVNYKTTANQDLFNDRNDAFDIIRNLFPLPSDLLNFSRTYSSMATIGRLLVPMDKNSNPLFEINKIEGQKPAPEDDESMRALESTIENILGFPLATLNTESTRFDYATSLIAQDGRLTTKILKLQEHYTEPASELASKIFRNYYNDPTFIATATFSKPKTLNSNLKNEQSAKYSEEIDNIIKIAYADTLDNSPLKLRYMRRKIATDMLKISTVDFNKLDQYERDWKVDKNVEVDKQKMTEENQ